MTAARTAEIAARFAARINGDSISKGFGTSVTAADFYDSARLITDAEDRLDALRLASADIGARIEALRLADPTSPLRPAGAAGLSPDIEDFLDLIDLALEARPVNGETQ